jgi:hypothetical protein
VQGFFLYGYDAKSIKYRYLNKPIDLPWEVSLDPPKTPRRRMDRLSSFEQSRSQYIREQFSKFLEVVGLHQQTVNS